MPSLIWPLPKVTLHSLSEHTEKRAVGLLTSPESWGGLSSTLDLPIVVQAEPISTDPAYLDTLSENVPSQVQVIYAVGTGMPVTAGKVVANTRNLPLVIVPDALDSDEIFEAHVVLPSEGLLNRIETGPAEEVIVDWDVIQAAPQVKRAAGIVDVLAIVTALLDWRYAARMNKNTEAQKFSPWGAGVAASLASQAIKSSKAIGEGYVEDLRTLLDLIMMSVQLAGQLGHDRHQEGTEHYFAFSMENQGVSASHAELVGAGILFASALHGQDPGSLRDALTNAGVDVDGLRASEIQLAVQDLPNFVATNALPFARTHDLDPLAEYVQKSLQKANILHEQIIEEIGEAVEVVEDAGEEVSEDSEEEIIEADFEEITEEALEEVTPDPTDELPPPERPQLETSDAFEPEAPVTETPAIETPSLDDTGNQQVSDGTAELTEPIEPVTGRQPTPPSNNAFATPAIDEEGSGETPTEE